MIAISASIISQGFCLWFQRGSMWFRNTITWDRTIQHVWNAWICTILHEFCKGDVHMWLYLGLEVITRWPADLQPCNSNCGYLILSTMRHRLRLVAINYKVQACLQSPAKQVNWWPAWFSPPWGIDWGWSQSTTKYKHVSNLQRSKSHTQGKGN